VTVAQAGSNLSADEIPAGTDDVAAEKGRSWWLTLPGLLTGLAGLISAITGLVVAVHQLRPASHPSTATMQASAPSTSPAQNTPASAVGARSHAGATSAGRSVGVAFTQGRHAQVGDDQYDVLAATARPGNPGEIGLALSVRMTNGGRYPANFWSSTFRLRIGTNISAPTNMLDDVVAAGTTDVGEVDFTLPANAARATLLVGDDARKAVALPIALNGAK
jgi:hypothetical protein